MIGHRSHFRENDDLLLWRGPAVKKRPPFSNARAPQVETEKPFKVAEHSFQVPMSNSPLLLNHLCFGGHFLQESRLTTEVFILAFWQGCVLLGNGAGKKQRLKDCFCLFKRNPVVRFFSSFAHYELTLTPFCQHYSNKILT